jgi:hypothetical protein
MKQGGEIIGNRINHYVNMKTAKFKRGKSKVILIATLAFVVVNSLFLTIPDQFTWFLMRSVVF